MNVMTTLKTIYARTLGRLTLLELLALLAVIGLLLTWITQHFIQ